MMEQKVELKPLSENILLFLYGNSPIKAEDAAIKLNLKTRQVDAAVTKSLVRWGFVIREYHLSRVLKREHSELKITDKGKRYVEEYLQNK